MADAEVTGLADLERLTKALKAAGTEGKGLRRELYSGLNRATKGIRQEMREATGSALPQGGGLAADVQRNTRYTTTTATSSRNLGVRIRARSKRSIRRMNQTGTVRHPVFGNRNVWVTQAVPSGFLDEPFERARPALQRSVLQAISDTKAKIYRSV